VPAMLTSAGVGYLVNSSRVKADFNAGVESVTPRKTGVGLGWLFLVATKPIAKHDEIVCPYHNSDQAVAASSSKRELVLF
jgi:hypothetical protein